MLAMARRRATEQGVQVRFQVGDAHTLEFKDRAFDVAVCLRVLMHTPQWRRCLAELRACLDARDRRGVEPGFLRHLRRARRPDEACGCRFRV